MDLTKRQEARAFDSKLRYSRAAISPDGTLVIAWPRPVGEFQIWSPASGKLVKRLERLGVGGNGVAGFSPNGRWLAIGGSKGYDFLEVRSWKRLFSFRQHRYAGVLDLDFSPDSRILAVAHSLTKVQLFDTETGGELATLEPPDPQNVVRLKFSPDGNLLAVIGARGPIQLWDLRLIRSELAAMNLDWELPARHDLRLGQRDPRQGLEIKSSLRLAALSAGYRCRAKPQDS